MKTRKEIAAILAAYDATESVRSAARLASCDPKTVRRYLAAREEGRPLGRPARRNRLIDGYLDKIEEWVERSQGHIRSERVHARLVRLGFTGSERTTRRAVAEVKSRWLGGDSQVQGPWTPEPGRWLQFGWSGGPVVPGPDGQPRRTVLFSAWLAWSRYRVVIPSRDHSLPALVDCLHSALRTMGGAPAYLLTRADRTEGTRHPELDLLARHFGSPVLGCVPYDPKSPHGSRPGWADGGAPRPVPPGVRIAVGDWLPVTADLPRALPSFAALRTACADFGDRVNRRRRDDGHGRTPYELLAAERARLHPLPAGRGRGGRGEPVGTARQVGADWGQRAG